MRAENDMIEELDTEERPGLRESIRNLFVVSGGFDIAARVIVSDDDRRCSIFQGRGEDFPWMNYRSIYQSDRDENPSDEFVGAVERECNKVFLIAISEMPHDRKCVRGRANPRTPRYEDSSAQFERRAEPRRDSIADTLHLGQFSILRYASAYRKQAVEGLGNGENIASALTAADNQCDDF